MYENMTTEELYTYYELKDLIMESQMSKCERDKLNDFLEEETNHTFDVDNLKKIINSLLEIKDESGTIAERNGKIIIFNNTQEAKDYKNEIKERINECNLSSAKNKELNDFLETKTNQPFDKIELDEYFNDLFDFYYEDSLRDSLIEYYTNQINNFNLPKEYKLELINYLNIMLLEDLKDNEYMDYFFEDQIEFYYEFQRFIKKEKEFIKSYLYFIDQLNLPDVYENYLKNFVYKNTHEYINQLNSPSNYGPFNKDFAYSNMRDYFDKDEFKLNFKNELAEVMDEIDILIKRLQDKPKHFNPEFKLSTKKQKPKKKKTEMEDYIVRVYDEKTSNGPVIIEETNKLQKPKYCKNCGKIIAFGNYCTDCERGL